MLSRPSPPVKLSSPAGFHRVIADVTEEQVSSVATVNAVVAVAAVDDVIAVTTIEAGDKKSVGSRRLLVFRIRGHRRLRH